MRAPLTLLLTLALAPAALAQGGSQTVRVRIVQRVRRGKRTTTYRATRTFRVCAS